MIRSEITRTEVLSAAFAQHRVQAQARLQEAMDAAGLTKAEGWSIVEFTREADGGTQLVMRPLHLTRSSPPNFQCVVAIVGDGSIEVHCDAFSQD
jgi:hypothetical protein